MIVAAKPKHPHTADQIATALRLTGSEVKAAKSLGLNRSTFRSMMRRFSLKEATAAGFRVSVEDKEPAREPEVDRLRKRVSGLEKLLREREQSDLSAAEIKRTIFGLADRPRRIPDWAVNPSASGPVASVPIMLWSDWHIGESVNSKEVGGVNVYNIAEAEHRVRALVDNTVDLCVNHMVNPDYPGAVVCLAGDFVTGEIHDELTQTNDIDLLPAVLRTVDLIAWSLTQLLRHFPSLYVPCVAGNHGRNTQKIQHKRFIFKNFDWLIYQLLQRHFVNEARITFDVPDDNQVFFNVYGHRYMLIHGHDLGVKGGDGIIGSSGPIIRGRVKSGLAAESMGSGYDSLLLGHFHTYMPLLASQALLVNGSLIGYTEYAKDRRFRYQRPVQSLHFHHAKHGPTAMWPVFVTSSNQPGRDRATVAF